MTTRYCRCAGGGFVVADDRDELRCMRCGREPEPPPCACRWPARSPRAVGRDLCRTCQRPIRPEAKEAT